MEAKTKYTLGLELPTDPRWVNMAELDLQEILTDHAYCEQKAAISGISLIQAYPEYERIVDEVTPVVAEEWSHFMMVLRELKRRNLKLGKQRRDEYVHKLLAFQQKGGSKINSLRERLLTFALIEARSCERFRLLSLHIADDALKKFYHKFMVSEAGHYRMFLDLAYAYCDKEKSQTRWKAYLEYEAEVMAEMTPRGDRMH